jgi:hypothetical protein
MDAWTVTLPILTQHLCKSKLRNHQLFRSDKSSLANSTIPNFDIFKVETHCEARMANQKRIQTYHM